MPLKSIRVQVWGQRSCRVRVRSPGGRHGSPGPLLYKGSSSRPPVPVSGSPHRSSTCITQVPAPNVFLNICEPSPQHSVVPVASQHLTGKD